MLFPKPKNDHYNSGGRRLIGHPSVFSNVCMQRTSDLNQRERERERERERARRRQRNQTTRTNKKQTKQVRGGGLGENAVPDVRVDDVERGQEENTRGTTNRNAVCVSPAPEEEKKRNATTANKNNQTTIEKKRDPRITVTGVGSWRANKSGQKISASERKHIPNPQTRKNESQKPKAESKIWEAKDRRVGGAHGPPRDLQRSILRVLDTEETQGLPRLGNRPQDSNV